MKNKILGASIVSIMMLSPLAHAVDILIPTDNKQSTYAVNLVSHSGKTWTYSVAQVKGRTLSHWVLGINNCLTNVVSSSPKADEIGVDPSTAARFVGIKWNTAGGTFSFTLDKDYQETTLQAFVKTATVYATGNVVGPDCSKEVSTGTTGTGSSSGSTGTTGTGSSSGSTGTTDTGSSSGSTGTTGTGSSSGSTGTTDTGSSSGSTGTTDTGSSSGSTGTTDTGSSSGSTGTTDTGSNSGSTGTTDTGSSSGSTGTTDTGSSSGSTGTTDTGSSSGSTGTTDTGSNKCVTASKAPKSTNVSWADSKGTNGYDIELVSVNGNTWTYRVTKTSGKALSHWVLGIPACNAHIVSSTSTDGSTAEIGKDASIKDMDFSGIKWNSEGGVFSFTLDNNYAATTVDVLAKAGTLKDGGYSTSSIMGPDCSSLAQSCSEKPLSGEQDVVGVHVWKRVTTIPISPEAYGALDKSKAEPGVYAVEKIDASGKTVDVQVEVVK